MSMKEIYQNQILTNWTKDKNYANRMAVPKISKVVVNVGFGNAKDLDKEQSAVEKDLFLITGQPPLLRKAKKAIAGFNLREGMTVGAKVTLRGEKMYQFLEKIFYFVLPQVRDFRGLPISGFDKMGNYSFGLEDQSYFLEIDPNQIARRRGLQVTIVTTSQKTAEAQRLLQELGLPLEKN